jgi:hypothetical protein
MQGATSFARLGGFGGVLMQKSLFLTGVWLAASYFAVAHAQNGAPPPTGGHHMQAPKTRAEVEARVREQFARLDTNKDGFLTEEELRPHMPTPAERQAMRDKMFAMMDKDGNGEISKAEFEAFHADHVHGRHGPGGRDGHEQHAMAAPADGASPHPHMRGHRGWHGMMARMMFRHADADHDGKVSLAEAEKAALDRFDKADTNHDGVISDAERQAARQQMAARFRERRAHWMDHKRDMPPPAPATPQG